MQIWHIYLYSAVEYNSYGVTETCIKTAAL